MACSDGSSSGGSGSSEINTASNAKPDAETLMNHIESLITGHIPEERHIISTESIITSMLRSSNDLSPVDRSIIAYGRYILGIAYLVCGRSSKADHHLSKLGMKWRLSSPVWIAGPCDPKKSEGTRSGGNFPEGLLHGWDRIFPTAIVDQLQLQLSPTSEYWRDHGYDLTDAKFFSYHYNLTMAPRTSIEVCVQHLRTFFQERWVLYIYI